MEEESSPSGELSSKKHRSVSRSIQNKLQESRRHLQHTFNGESCNISNLAPAST
jgi:hypothetical protein